MAEKITSRMSVSRILSAYPLSREVFKRNGIRFIGRDISPLESLEVVGRGNELSGGQIQAIVEEINQGAGKEAGVGGTILKVGPGAAGKLKEVLKERGMNGIRLRLVSSGCAIYSYDMDVGTKKREGEIEFRAGGVRFFLARKTLGLIRGLEIEYREQEGGVLHEQPSCEGGIG